MVCFNTATFHTEPNTVHRSYDALQIHFQPDMQKHPIQNKKKQNPKCNAVQRVRTVDPGCIDLLKRMSTFTCMMRPLTLGGRIMRFDMWAASVQSTDGPW